MTHIENYKSIHSLYLEAINIPFKSFSIENILVSILINDAYAEEYGKMTISMKT